MPTGAERGIQLAAIREASDAPIWMLETNVITITPNAPVQNLAAEHVSSVERSSAFRPRELRAPDRLVRFQVC